MAPPVCARTCYSVSAHLTHNTQHPNETILTFGKHTFRFKSIEGQHLFAEVKQRALQKLHSSAIIIIVLISNNIKISLHRFSSAKIKG